ncbi:hypothetical protein BH11PAT4_BH11PAT4_2080 [soil metagenome]
MKTLVDSEIAAIRALAAKMLAIGSQGGKICCQVRGPLYEPLEAFRNKQVPEDQREEVVEEVFRAWISMARPHPDSEVQLFLHDQIGEAGIQAKLEAYRQEEGALPIWLVDCMHPTTCQFELRYHTANRDELSPEWANANFR